MVLQKVGEYLTTIKVNGVEKISTLQTTDKTYEITDEQGVELYLNGELVDSYNQTSDSSYDISAYGENVNTETLTFPFSVGYDTEGSAFASFTVPASLDGYVGSVNSNGDISGVTSTNEDISYSGTFNEGDTFDCLYSGAGTDEAAVSSLTASVEVPVDPEVVPTGSTKL